MLYSCEQISCTWPVPSVRFSVKLHLTKCHDHCDVLHDVVSLLYSIVCSVHNDISPISPYTYQICVGKLMPLSTMLLIVIVTINLTKAEIPYNFSGSDLINDYEYTVIKFYNNNLILIVYL